jgi:hypothetical protein
MRNPGENKYVQVRGINDRLYVYSIFDTTDGEKLVEAGIGWGNPDIDALNTIELSIDEWEKMRVAMTRLIYGD